MATTTATITINSTDLLTDELSLSTTATLTAAGNSTGLVGSGGLGRKKLASGHAQYILFDGDAYANGAHKIYLKNTSTTAAEYFTIEINSEQMGKLYAGDWALIPWDGTGDFKYTPGQSDSTTVEYMMFHEG